MGGKAPGSRLAPTALATTGAAETLRRVGAARSHLPLIEFICYNPKQCKAGFSQAPAACLPIKIPSRTANPPSRLDIKQPVSKMRQAKPPCTRADPPHPIPLPQGRWPAGLRVPSRVASGEIRVLQGDPKPPAKSRPTVWEPISVVSEQGQAEPRPVHRLFPVGFSIPVGVAGSGPVAGVVTSPPPPKLGIPKPAARLPSPTPSHLGCKTPWCLRWCQLLLGPHGSWGGSWSPGTTEAAGGQQDRGAWRRVGRSAGVDPATACGTGARCWRG